MLYKSKLHSISNRGLERYNEVRAHKPRHLTLRISGTDEGVNFCKFLEARQT